MHPLVRLAGTGRKKSIAVHPSLLKRATSPKEIAHHSLIRSAALRPR